jgi:hypothetical protein
MLMYTDPREMLNQAAMARLQYVVIAITVALNALDGFDVMAISFASPGIAAEWNTTMAGLGFILSMELCCCLAELPIMLAASPPYSAA